MGRRNAFCILHFSWRKKMSIIRNPQGKLRELGRGPLAFLLNIPAAVFLLLIIAYPLLYAFYLAFHKVGVRELRTGKMPYVGWQNFLMLFQDEVFWLALKQTFLFVGTAVVLEVVLGLCIALVMNEQRIFLSRVTRLLVLLPWAIPPIVNGLLWSFIYSSKYGYLNIVLAKLGLITEFIQWLGDPNIALFAVILPYVWRTTPFAVLLFHAALQGIPEELYEAAEVDGANAWSRLRKITLPLLSPTIAVVLVLRTTFAFMVFDEIFAMTQGGPGNATWVSAWYTYRAAFQPPFEIGVGAASAYVLAFIIGLIAVLYIRFLYRQVEW
jgi:ABC-type sugar transport system permease subunit